MVVFFVAFLFLFRSLARPFSVYECSVFDDHDDDDYYA